MSTIIMPLKPSRSLISAVFCTSLFICGLAEAQPVSRSTPAEGSVVSTLFGEEIEFIENPIWQNVQVLQDVVSGDVLRTNATGALAILFSDRTQVRIARNSTLVVKKTGGGGDTELELKAGSLFARAARGGTGVSVATPAATAAIRGTDWALTVNGDTTSLSVLEGTVEFFNPQGSVTVREGEAATATLGQAPSKVIVVNSDTREQMLINISLRNAFGNLPASPLSGRELRAEEARLARTPLERRSAEDRVTAAEIVFSTQGLAAAEAAIAEARALRLTAAQEARLVAIEASIAAADQRYDEASRLYARALPHLSGERRGLALYQAYFSRALADPSRSESPPVVGGEAGLIGRVIVAALLEGPQKAYALIQAEAPRHQDDPEFQATIAEAAMLLGRFDEAKAAIDRGFALDPEEESLFAVRADYRARVSSDLDGALADLNRAIAASPGTSSYWNDLGLLQSERGANREAEQAFLRSIELAPKDPIGYVNYAIFLLDQDQVDAAKAQVDKAVALDPSFYMTQLIIGRLRFQSGELDAAADGLLRATTADPTVSQGLLLLSSVYATQGERELSAQAIDNADRLDRNDPAVAQYRALIAIDEYRADDAIRYALDSVERTQARGGDYASVNATRESGSTVGDAFRFAGLPSWARYYGDIVYDPFLAGSYIDQSLSGGSNILSIDTDYTNEGIDTVANPSSFSALFQGLLLDPLAIPASKQRPNLIRAPLSEAEVSGGVVSADGDTGFSGGGEYQFLKLDGLPTALYANITYDHASPSFSDQDREATSGTAFLGFHPTPYDRIVGFGAFATSAGGLGVREVEERAGDTRDIEAYSAGLGWSHSFGYQNVLNAAVFATRREQTDAFDVLDIPAFLLERDIEQYQETVTGGLSQTLGVDTGSIGIESLVLRYGSEFGYSTTDAEITDRLTIPGAPPVEDVLEADDEGAFGRLYVDALAEITPDIQAEVGLFAAGLAGDAESRLEPRAAIGWQPLEGQWLRAGFIRESSFAGEQSLAPIGVLRLNSNLVPLGDDGYTDSLIARWDAEWSRAFFTSVEYQHQAVNNFSVTIPTTLQAFEAEDATIDRLTLTANAWLGHGVALFGTLALTETSVDSGAREGDDLPFVPDTIGRFGFTYTHPSRVQLTVAEDYVGSRPGSEPFSLLDDFWTTSATLSWESMNRRLKTDLAVYNIFDAESELSEGNEGNGRTAVARLAVRF
ncbi:FecR domain-containing protein [Mangrovicella endophytica]|uniref:FecR domain-containing protein n=1 Tax=Mangrovicella endophytica TaxID=2066697 RepID=UPI000C9DB6FC|nr:FecR domain-containing protein [Mangrovicella endophytica]